jgi:hypothetical protein
VLPSTASVITIAPGTKELPPPSTTAPTTISEFTRSLIKQATESTSSQGPTIPSFLAPDATRAVDPTAIPATTTTTATLLSEIESSIPPPSIDVESLAAEDKEKLMALTTKRFVFQDKTYYGVLKDDVDEIFPGGRSRVLFSEVRHRVDILKALMSLFKLSSPLGDDWCSDLPAWNTGQGVRSTPYAYFNRNNARLIVALQKFYNATDASRTTGSLLSFSQTTKGKSRFLSPYIYIPVIEDTWDPDVSAWHNLWRRYGGLYHLMKHGNQWEEWYKNNKDTNFLTALSASNVLLSGDEPSTKAIEYASRISASSSGSKDGHEGKITTSMADIRSAPVFPHGLTSDDVTMVKTIGLKKPHVVARLGILRGLIEQEVRADSMGDVDSFLADPEWERNLPNFTQQTKSIYARLHRAAARLIFVTSGLLEHLVEAMKRFDEGKGGTAPSAEVQAIEDHFEEDGMMETFWWRLERFYELISRTAKNKRLLDMINRFKILNEYPAHKRYLALISCYPTLRPTDMQRTGTFGCSGILP